MQPERVLLVDDEEDFVEALTGRLEARGVLVQSASTGDEALARVREARFDAIVLDLAMPGMDGIETLRALKRLDPDLQVILLTGRATLQKGVEAMKLGAMDFLEKPVPVGVLMEKIREARTRGSDLEEQRTGGIISDILTTRGW